MKSAIERILVQIRPKIAAILRTRQHYDAKDLIGQFKTHVWGIMEQNNGAIFHASRYLLEKLDSCQRSFLKKLDMNEEAAFLDFNFAPPSLRRDIGILGMLHKRVLGLAHPIFDRLLPFHCESHGASTGSHTKQLYGHILQADFQLHLHKRSIFGMVHIYNRLPQEIIDSETVALFQSKLTKLARSSCKEELAWQAMFSCRPS